MTRKEQMSADVVRIMIVDDHAIVRLGVANLLARQPGWVVVAEAGTMAEAIQLAAEHQPEIVLLDIRLPDGSGLDACRQIVQAQPQVKVIILTSYADDELLTKAVSAGAAGYVLKQVGNDDLLRVIKLVLQGKMLLDRDQTRRILAQGHESGRPEAFADLTDQELRVLALISQGKTNRKIAASMNLGEGTIRNYVSTVLDKLGAANRAEASAYAVRHKLDDYLNSLK
jgi:two-component system response regulator DevR